MASAKDKELINFCDNVRVLFSTNNIVDSVMEKQKMQFITILSDKNILSILKDEEMMTTLQSFFDNNLNVSQTSKKTFMHRNTLIYRLEKVRKTIGLNLKNFEDAVIFENLNTIYKKFF